MKKTARMRHWLLALMSMTTASVPVQPIRFSDATEAANLGHDGTSYAVAAADVDRNGWPDIAVSRHNSVVLLINDQGRFTSIELERNKDSHGLSWMDYNRDGWPDLYVSRGGRRGRGEGWPSGLYLNDGHGRLQPSEVSPALANRRGRGRSALPYDVDHDGHEDLIILNHQRPSYVAMSGGDQRPLTHALMGGGTLHATATREELFTTGLFPSRISLQRSPGIPMPLEIRRSRNLGLTRQIISADFNNDLWPDLYLVRGSAIDHRVERVGQSLLFNLVSHGPTAPAFSFESEGPFQIELWAEGAALHAVDLGRSTVSIAADDWFSPEDPRLLDLPSPTAPSAVTLRKDGRAIRLTARLGENLQTVSGLIRFQQPFSHIWAGKPPAPVPGVLAVNHSDFFVSEREKYDTGDGSDGVAADFDRDGDLDLYVVNGGFGFGNTANTTLINRWGRLRPTVAGPAAVGPSRGRGCCAVGLDYDRDGDIDIFVANGEGGPPGNEGPEMLLRNDSLPRHWLMVELAGRVVWGARVEVTTGDQTQLRTMTPGNGRMASSWLPLHFGLASNDKVTVRVVWPDGHVEQVETAVDKMVRVERFDER